MDQTGFLVISGSVPSGGGGNTILRNSYMHIASESGSTSYPTASNLQTYDLDAFINDTVNRPVIYTQNTLGFDPINANGTFDISWLTVGYEFRMSMTLARYGPTSINQRMKFNAQYKNSFGTTQRTMRGVSNFINNDNQDKIILFGHRQTASEDNISVGSFSSDENDDFTGGQENEYAIVEFEFFALTGY